MSIHVQPFDSFIAIDGVKYIVPKQQAQFAEILLKANGEVVAYEYLMGALSTTRGTIQVLAFEVRQIFKNHGYELINEFKEGYRLKKRGA